ncbi:hypothetical protein NECAME_15875 [Necator americanus]|uniref:Uncharacterized protein n=1 Tax=Necator americanus TaxID=51031 RepID=W2SHK4_NECAM|nr:hypothetical protein NECAME_15875 [Necator americanus]ETN68336.1 hypothetical protein NECAME_15875 [Necator americanus]
MESFKNDKNKHIQLLLEGISSRELDNLNSEQSSLEVCEISDDDESLCTRSCVVASASPPNEDVNDAVSNETNCANGIASFRSTVHSKQIISPSFADSKSIRRATPQASTCSNETLDFDCGLHLHDRELSRHCEVPSTSCTRAFTILDRSEYERRLLSENEQITEEERQMSIYETSPYGDSEVEDSHRAAMEINDAVSQLAPDIEMSEVISKLMKEDVAAEFSDAGTPSKRSKRCYVEPFDEDSNTTGSECSDINIDVNILYEISELRREEGASSPSSCSIDSDVIFDLRIEFFMWYHHFLARLGEVKDAVPPDVCVWHPQTWTYNIDLITHFRSPSPFEEAVVTLLPREYVELTVIAPKYEEMFAAVELIRRFPHSGAFTRKRGGRCVSVSFNIPAPRNQNVFLECDLWRTTQANEFYHYVAPESCMDYVSLKSESSKEEFCLLESHIKNAKQENEDCLIEMEDRRVSADYLSTNASTHECCDVHCDIYNAAGISDCSYIQCEDSHFQNVSLNAKEAEENVVDVFQAIARTQDHTERCSAMFSDTRRTYASLSCSAPRCEDVVTYWVFDILLGNSAITTLNDKRIYKVAHSCKPRSLRAERGPLRMNVEAPTRRRRQGDSMNEVLLLLETGAMPSQFIETSPPHSLPLNKGRTRSRYQNLRGAIGPGNRGKGEAVASQLQETLLITPRKRPCLEVSPTTRPERSPALRSPSERSDLSASPDRLVICEDEDAIAEEDRIKVTEDLQNTPSNALAISTKSSTASLEEESFDNYTTPSEKPSLNVTDFPLLRRSARKRSADHSESPVVAKKSREPVEHTLISKQGGKSEESIEIQMSLHLSQNQ